MKNNKECRGLLLAGTIFNFSFIIAYFMSRTLFAGAGFSDVSGILGGMALLLGASLGILCVAIQGYLYYSKLEKNILILGNSVASSVIAAFIVLALFGTLSGTFVIISLVISILLLVENILVILSLEEKIVLDALHPYLPKLNIGQNDIVVDNGDTQTKASNPIAIDSKNIKDFFKSKLGIGIVATTIVCIVAFGGYKAWDVFFNKTTIDVFEKMELSFAGYDGEGEAEVDSVEIDYDKSNIDIISFVSGVNYEIVDNGKLSNDKKVTVRATYSKETADSLKIDVKNETKEFEVSGLIIRYDSAKDLDKDLYKEAKDSVDEAVKEYSDSTYTYVNSYFAKEEKGKKSTFSKGDYLVFVYKEEYKAFLSDEINTRYVYARCAFDSSFDGEDIYISPSTLYAELGTRMDNVEQLPEALTYTISKNYKYEKID